MRIIAQHKGWWIIEDLDFMWSLSDLEGDSFDPKANPEISLENLKQQQRQFRAQVNNKGVWGYTLQKWNPEVDQGWEHVDSCWGFIGRYNAETNPHDIVTEFLERIYNALDLTEPKVL
jgi:hypothetical protein